MVLSSGVDEDANPCPHPPNGAVPRIADNVALYRAGDADEPLRGVGREADDDSSSSDLQPGTYRSYPETDHSPHKRR